MSLRGHPSFLLFPWTTEQEPQRKMQRKLFRQWSKPSLLSRDANCFSGNPFCAMLFIEFVAKLIDELKNFCESFDFSGNICPPLVVRHYLLLKHSRMFSSKVLVFFVRRFGSFACCLLSKIFSNDFAWLLFFVSSSRIGFLRTLALCVASFSLTRSLLDTKKNCNIQWLLRLQIRINTRASQTKGNYEKKLPLTKTTKSSTYHTVLYTPFLGDKLRKPCSVNLMTFWGKRLLKYNGSALQQFLHLEVTNWTELRALQKIVKEDVTPTKRLLTLVGFFGFTWHRSSFVKVRLRNLISF